MSDDIRSPEDGWQDPAADLPTTGPHLFCRYCGHWEHDPGSCDALGHLFSAWDVPIVGECNCETHDDRAIETERFIGKIADIPDDALNGSSPGRILSLIRAKARQLEQYDGP